MVYDKWFMREYPTKKMDLLGGLVAINFIFPYIGLLSSSQLTKSIIFQDGVALAHQPALNWMIKMGYFQLSNKMASSDVFFLEVLGDRPHHRWRSHVDRR